MSNDDTPMEQPETPVTAVDDANTPFDSLVWDDLRLFVALADEGSLRRAAARAGVSSTTVLRRVAALEALCKGRLLDRNPEGARPTLLGQQVLDIARTMQGPVADLERLIAGHRGERRWVSITVTQGLGVNWLIPNAASFQAEHPMIGVDFRISNTVADILRFDSDLAIQMTPPTAADVVAIKLGRMHFELFASRDYLEAHGRPTTVEALRNHRFIEQWDGHVSNGHLVNLLGPVRAIQVVIKVQGSAGAIAAIERGLGIGALPNYSVAFGNQVVPLGLPVTAHRDIWLTYRREARESPAVSATILWLKALFDSRTWPWFKDTFASAAVLPPLSGPMPE